MSADLLGLLRDSWQPLPDKPDETPEAALSALTAASNGDEAALRSLVEQRASGVPLAHLTGRQVFMSIAMLAGSEALIPRAETEIVCRGALGKLLERPSARVIDVCCGAGNIALALAWHAPGCTVFGADISEAAIGLARRNAAHLGLAERVHFEAGDLFAPFDALGPVDLITCNPPYISSAKVEKMAHEVSGFEPRLAFDGGPFGVKILTRIVREAPRHLKPDSWLAFEVGLGQGKAMEKMLRASPDFAAVEALSDQSGETRALLARTASASV
jgi:release factor glutamine methyltransferase